MSMMLSQIQTGVVHKPPRIVIYGVHGVGKTSLAAGAPDPILIQTEDGADEIGVARFPLAKTLDDVYMQIGELVTEDHGFRTVIFDSADWAEKLVWEATCEDNGWKSIEAPGFGKGYVEAENTWKKVLEGFDALRAKGMCVIILAHCEVKRFDDPTNDGYDRYQIAVHKRASETLQEWADAVLFLNWRTMVQEKDQGMGRKITKGKGNGQRILYTEERPAAIAKNRYGMPDKIDLPNNPTQTWGALAQHLPFFA
ncbi:ATP-binding protein [Acetobacter sacchari]|uniref:ATP-binding protein n=1 Tax=Acetobacter sacchari TaxID=2661687 RepID=A0ABS3M1A1_9PROT|nr:ATP-binding protein [Acetobacter sacchari]MBO1361895.1 ATP-binding protein [Acetobacter sacchari]